MAIKWLNQFLKSKHYQTYLLWIGSIVVSIMTFVLIFSVVKIQNSNDRLTSQLASSKKTLNFVKADLDKLKKQDQYVRNEVLQKEIKDIEDNYKKSVTLYESILDLDGEIKEKDKEKLTSLFADSLTYLSKRNFASGAATLSQLSTEIDKEKASLAAVNVPKNIAVNNSPPSSGYQRQIVESDVGSNMVDIISADLNSTKVIVDTASGGDCGDNCPVDSLGSYAGRSGAYAGVNGPYFCPAEYPSCVGKKNSFDTLLMNKNKTYFNSANNVYSTVPAFIFQGSSARMVGQSLEWGRDTGPDSVIASQPMLLSGNNIMFGGSGQPKEGIKSNRAFIGNSGSTVYIGVVYNVTVAESAHVLKKLGIQNALNLDSGGSTALWYNGSYIAGPGRNTPFGILLVRK